MNETIADRLAIAATQVQTTSDRMIQGGVTAEELAPIAAYLTALTEHGYQITSLALCAAQDTAPEHPIRSDPHGNGVQAALDHVKALFDLGIHFAGHAEHNMHSMHPDSTV
jgi:hypothetical protein